ncbi:MAG: type II toxin-antitoxin system RelE/ParE family toxin [Phycisphaerae bacterium]|nr:type II toxin-antitoxin system RelE/ParE family toxin [Phycisphaerae bacterium]
MKRRVNKSSAALRDLAELGAYIGHDSLEAELRFFKAAQVEFERLAKMPRLGKPHILQNPRNGIDVIRVLHGARDVESILEAEESEE